MYSIIRQLHRHKDKQGRQKIQIKVTYKRIRVYLKTDFRIVQGADNPKIDAIVRRRMAEAEDKLLDALREGPLTTEKFKTLFKEEKKIFLVDYFDQMITGLKGKLSEGTLKQYKVIAGKIDPYSTFDSVNIKWMEAFEKRIHSLDINTINTNLKRLKAMLSRAVADGYLKKDQYSGYKVPTYKQKLPEYHTEKDISTLTKTVKVQTVRGKRIAGFYYLLSCYTGWRISDVKRFNKNMIHGKSLVLRAKKNGQIVSMPIIPRLKEVLNFVINNPFDISEQRVRDYVKDLCDQAGVKKVKFHSGRHSYAMMLMANGFTIDEAAELLGDSVLISKVYARVHNESLDKKIRERLG